MNNRTKAFLPHIVAVISFLIVSYIYFLPAIEGKTLNGTDNITAKSQQGEIGPYTGLTGNYSAWTNGSFGGMPAYTFWVKKDAPLNVIYRIIEIITFGAPVNYIFIALISFYILLIVCRVNPWLSIAGSFAYAFSTGFIVFIGAGHITKVLGIAFMPGVIAGILIAYKRGKILAGAIIMALFLALEISPGHYQVVYYTMIVAGTIGLFYFVNAIKKKKILKFSVTTGVLILALILAILTNLSSIWTIQEYTPYSARGNSELKLEDESNRPKSGSGLNFDYAMQWSYGISESLNLLIPNFRGGSSSGSLSEDSEVYKLFSRQNVAQAKQVIEHFPLYWGNQPSTEGPVYMGAVILFLFVFGLFFIKNKVKWWILAVTFFALLLAWGNNFEWFNRIIFDYFPMYNKFRAVTTSLIIVQLTVPFLAMLALQELVIDYNKQLFLNALKWSFVLIGGLTLMFSLFPGLAGNFRGPSDSMLGDNQTLIDAVVADRKSLLRSDAFRSFLFIGIAVITLWLYHSKKVNKGILALLLATLILIDLAFVDTRFIGYSDFHSQRVLKSNFMPSEADKSIYQMEASNPDVKSKVDSFLVKYKETDVLKEHESPELLALNLTTDYRVLNLSNGINFSDALTSYYHKSISGYSPAKLRRFQDLIDHGLLVSQIQNLVNYLQTGQNPNSFNLLNMLNTKYIIANRDQPAIVNSKAFGNAWFVKSIKWAKDANEEYENLSKIDPLQEVILNTEFDGLVQGSFGYDSTATISLINYSPDALTYLADTKITSIAVFSEIYYPKGWRVFIDGEPVEHFRANYLFRAMQVPAGKHKIEFRFEPRSYLLGNKVNVASSVLLIILCLAMGGYYLSLFFIRRNKA